MTSNIISGDQNVAAGYTTAVCVKCTVSTGGSAPTYEVSSNSWSITQLPDCSTGLVAKSYADQTIAYNSATSTVQLNTGGYTDIFTHTDPTNCPLTSCAIFAPDCSAAVSSEISMATNIVSGK